MFPRAQEHAANMLGLMPVWYARGVNIAPRSISCRLEKTYGFVRQVGEWRRFAGGRQ